MSTKPKGGASMYSDLDDDSEQYNNTVQLQAKPQHPYELLEHSPHQEEKGVTKEEIHTEINVENTHNILGENGFGVDVNKISFNRHSKVSMAEINLVKIRNRKLLCDSFQLMKALWYWKNNILQRTFKKLQRWMLANQFFRQQKHSDKPATNSLSHQRSGSPNDKRTPASLRVHTLSSRAKAVNHMKSSRLRQGTPKRGGVAMSRYLKQTEDKQQKSTGAQVVNTSKSAGATRADKHDSSETAASVAFRSNSRFQPSTSSINSNRVTTSASTSTSIREGNFVPTTRNIPLKRPLATNTSTNTSTNIHSHGASPPRQILPVVGGVFNHVSTSTSPSSSSSSSRGTNSSTATARGTSISNNPNDDIHQAPTRLYNGQDPATTSSSSSSSSKWVHSGTGSHYGGSDYGGGGSGQRGPQSPLDAAQRVREAALAMLSSPMGSLTRGNIRKQYTHAELALGGEEIWNNNNDNNNQISAVPFLNVHHNSQSMPWSAYHHPDFLEGDYTDDDDDDDDSAQAQVQVKAQVQSAAVHVPPHLSISQVSTQLQQQSPTLPPPPPSSSAPLHHQHEHHDHQSELHYQHEIASMTVLPDAPAAASSIPSTASSPALVTTRSAPLQLSPSFGSPLGIAPPLHASPSPSSSLAGTATATAAEGGYATQLNELSPSVAEIAFALSKGCELVPKLFPTDHPHVMALGGNSTNKIMPTTINADDKDDTYHGDGKHGISDSSGRIALQGAHHRLRMLSGTHINTSDTACASEEDMCNDGDRVSITKAPARVNPANSPTQQTGLEALQPQGNRLQHVLSNFRRVHYQPAVASVAPVFASVSTAGAVTHNAKQGTDNSRDIATYSTGTGSPISSPAATTAPTCTADDTTLTGSAAGSRTNALQALVARRRRRIQVAVSTAQPSAVLAPEINDIRDTGKSSGDDYDDGRHDCLQMPTPSITAAAAAAAARDSPSKESLLKYSKLNVEDLTADAAQGEGTVGVTRNSYDANANRIYYNARSSLNRNSNEKSSSSGDFNTALMEYEYLAFQRFRRQINTFRGYNAQTDRSNKCAESYYRVHQLRGVFQRLKYTLLEIRQNTAQHKLDEVNARHYAMSGAFWRIRRRLSRCKDQQYLEFRGARHWRRSCQQQALRVLLQYATSCITRRRVHVGSQQLHALQQRSSQQPSLSTTMPKPTAIAYEQQHHFSPGVRQVEESETTVPLSTTAEIASAAIVTGSDSVTVGGRNTTHSSSSAKYISPPRNAVHLGINRNADDFHRPRVVSSTSPLGVNYNQTYTSNSDSNTTATTTSNHQHHHAVIPATAIATAFSGIAPRNHSDTTASDAGNAANNGAAADAAAKTGKLTRRRATRQRPVRTRCKPAPPKSAAAAAAATTITAAPIADISGHQNPTGEDTELTRVLGDVIAFIQKSDGELGLSFDDDDDDDDDDNDDNGVGGGGDGKAIEILPEPNEADSNTRSTIENDMENYSKMQTQPQELPQQPQLTHQSPVPPLPSAQLAGNFDSTARFPAEVAHPVPVLRADADTGDTGVQQFRKYRFTRALFCLNQWCLRAKSNDAMQEILDSYHHLKLLKRYFIRFYNIRIYS